MSRLFWEAKTSYASSYTIVYKYTHIYIKNMLLK